MKTTFDNLVEVMLDDITQDSIAEDVQQATMHLVRECF